MHHTMILLCLATLAVGVIYYVVRPQRKVDTNNKQENEADEPTFGFIDDENLFSDTDIVSELEHEITMKDIVVEKENYKWYNNYRVNIIVYSILVLLSAVVIILSYEL